MFLDEGLPEPGWDAQASLVIQGMLVSTAERCLAHFPNFPTFYHFAPQYTVELFLCQGNKKVFKWLRGNGDGHKTALDEPKNDHL
jgi:hypothetical protein